MCDGIYNCSNSLVDPFNLVCDIANANPTHYFYLLPDYGTVKWFTDRDLPQVAVVD